MLLLVRCKDFQALQTQFHKEFRFFQCIRPDTYEVVALDTIDLSALGDSAEVENPYNPTCPDQDLIEKHGDKLAKELKRKSFLDRWALKARPKGFGVYMHCMAGAFPKDYCWIMNYFLQRVFTAEATETPVVPTDFKLLGICVPMDRSQFSSALEDHGFDRKTVLSLVHVNVQYGRANVYEVWVSKEIMGKFLEVFKSYIVDGFDPMLSVGAFETAVAQERLLERVKQTNHTVRQLYLHYLKVKWPHSYIWAVEELGQLGRRDRKGFFWLLGIGENALQVPFAALQQVGLILLHSKYILIMP
jgi:hypothetical protein